MLRRGEGAGCRLGGEPVGEVSVSTTGEGEGHGATLLFGLQSQRAALGPIAG